MPPIRHHHAWHAAIRQWGLAWECAGLEQRIVLAVSPRFVSTLGRYEYRERRITIASFLIDGPEALLQEILCHEAAHAAVAELHTHRVRPHGREWRALMRAAGFRPRARIALEEIRAAVAASHGNKRLRKRLGLTVQA